MGDIFGRRWYVDNGAKPPVLWKKALKAMSIERSRGVLQHYLVSGDDHPPNLSQVNYVARSIKPSIPEQKQLERPRTPEAAARSCMSMKDVLAKATRRLS